MRGRPPTPTLSALAPDQNLDLLSENQRSPQFLEPEVVPTYAGLSSRNSPELHSTDIQGQYVDPTSGLSFLERARDRVSSHRTPSGHVTQDEDWSYRQQAVLNAGDKPLALADGDSSTMTALPDGDHATGLLDIYFDVCVATYKPLHRPTLDAWHKQALQNVIAERPRIYNLGHAKLSTLFAVFAVATYHQRKTLDFSLNESDALFGASLELTKNETGLPRLDSVQARLIQVFYLLMTCRMNQAWFTFGTVLQLISSLGLHRREKRPRQDRDYVYRQCQQRTFWTTYILDKYFGVLMGRPQHFHDDDIDQDYPDCVNDEDMTATGCKISEDPDDCLIEAFVENAKLARITYVWQIQKPRFDCGLDTEHLFKLAERCQTHLAHATASNSPSRRYSIILEELRAEAGVNSGAHPAAGLIDDGTALTSIPAFEADQGDFSAAANLFESWQISDWLDLDALAYGYPTGSSPDLGCFDPVFS
ncbi:hypothetical protein KCU99_g7164, partial [Aureobasidium melanogenum]